jgi:hypothetical protein
MRYLNVKHNQIGDAGYRFIAESQSLPQLSVLRIYEGNLGSVESRNALKRARAMQALRHIS